MTKAKGKGVLGALLAGMLAGCSLVQPTPYQPYGMVGGFKEVELTPQVYQVYFSGNNRTPNLQAGNYLLRRCGELVLERGYRHFAVLSFGMNGVGLLAAGKTVTVRLLDADVAKDLLAKQAKNKQAEILIFDAESMVADEKSRYAALSLLYQANFTLARSRTAR